MLARTRSLRLSTTALLAAAALALGACNAGSAEEEAEFGDVTPLTKELTKQLDTSGDYEATVDSVACPNSSDERGATFTCNGITDGGEVINVEVTITDDDGNFTWKQSDSSQS